MQQTEFDLSGEMMRVRVLPQLRWRSKYQLRVGKENEIEFRVPASWSLAKIGEVQHKHRRWIAARQAEWAAKKAVKKVDAALDWCVLPETWWRKAARKLLPKLVGHWAAVMGIEVRGMRYTGARTRWGSCTVGGVLSFSYRLLQTEWSLVEYVVVHELAHRRVFNHSPKFWAEVERWMPDYDARRVALRKYAGTIG